MWTKMSFAAAKANFDAGARRGVDAVFYWPGFGEVTWDELLLRHLLPDGGRGTRPLGGRRPRPATATSASSRTGARPGATGRGGRSGPSQAFEDRGLARDAALTEMLKLYSQGMHSNEPVHTWELPD